MMSVLINHCWCSDSNWGGEYNGRVIIGIKRIAEGKTYYDPPTEDWTNLIDKVEIKLDNLGYPKYSLENSEFEIEYPVALFGKNLILGRGDEVETLLLSYPRKNVKLEDLYTEEEFISLDKDHKNKLGIIGDITL